MLFYSSSEKKLVSPGRICLPNEGGSKYIYYVCGESVSRIDHLPQIELRQGQGYEVLYLTDEILMSSPSKCSTPTPIRSSAPLRTATWAWRPREEKRGSKKQTEGKQPLLDFPQGLPGGQGQGAVRLSQKLKSHPVCLSSDGPLSIEMERSSTPARRRGKGQRAGPREINAGHLVFGKLRPCTPTHPNRTG